MKRFILYMVGGETRHVSAEYYRNVDGFVVFYANGAPIAQVSAHTVAAVDEETGTGTV